MLLADQSDATKNVRVCIAMLEKKRTTTVQTQDENFYATCLKIASTFYIVLISNMVLFKKRNLILNKTLLFCPMAFINYCTQNQKIPYHQSNENVSFDD